MHGFFERRLEQDDSVVSAAIRLELARQQDQIELIASENIVSPAVLAAQGTRLLTRSNETELESRFGRAYRVVKYKKIWRTRHDSNV
jgi:glycine/serine hydroxymethyltransferase